MKGNPVIWMALLLAAGCGGKMNSSAPCAGHGMNIVVKSGTANADYTLAASTDESTRCRAEGVAVYDRRIVSPRPVYDPAALPLIRLHGTVADCIGVKLSVKLLDPQGKIVGTGDTLIGDPGSRISREAVCGAEFPSIQIRPV